MTTIPKSVKTQLDTDWTGAGGAKPTYYLQEEDFRTPPPLGEDSVWIMSKSLDTGAPPVNDTFVNEEHVLTLIVNTAKVTGGADRLKELSDEVVRILNATAITDITYQRMRKRNREVTQNQGIWVFQEVIVYDLKEQMKSSAAAYGAGATGDFIVLGDIFSSTSFSHEKALMLGSANAAYVPCGFGGEASTAPDSGSLGWRNVDATDTAWMWTLPLPPIKGSLKLSITNVKIVIQAADANDYVDRTRVFGVDNSGFTAIFDDGTNLTTAGDKESGDEMGAWGAATDVSGYDGVHVYMNTVVTDAVQLNIQSVLVECYYDT